MDLDLPAPIDNSGDEAQDQCCSDSELPVAVGSDSEQNLSVDPQADLPEDVEDVTSGNCKAWHCNCKRGCITTVPAETVDQLRKECYDKDPAAKKKHQFDVVRRELLANTNDGRLLPNKSESDATGAARVRYEFKVNGTQVCLKFFLHCHALSGNRYNEIKKMVVAGHAEEPEHAARIPSNTSHWQWNVADAWFLMVYKDIAEPMAETFNESEVAGGHAC